MPFGCAFEAVIVSVLIAAALGAPMHSQLSYLIGLPMTVAAPVRVRSLAWLLLVEIGRAAAVHGDLLNRRAVYVAAVVAILITVPKVLLIGFAMIDT